MNLEKDLELAKNAAREAGTYLKSKFREQNKGHSEKGKDIKLEEDKQSEKIIIDILSSSPYKILAEESGETKENSGNLQWIIDPLDGTINYFRGIPDCSVSIGLFDGDSPMLGVVYDFLRNELYSGIVSYGAWLNDYPIKVSSKKEISKSILALGMPLEIEYSRQIIDEFFSKINEYQKVRIFGSCALSLAHLASGRIDAYMQKGVKLWDFAGGVAIVMAAGGDVKFKKLSDLDYDLYVSN